MHGSKVSDHLTIWPFCNNKSAIFLFFIRTQQQFPTLSLLCLILGKKHGTQIPCQHYDTCLRNNESEMMRMMKRITRMMIRMIKMVMRMMMKKITMRIMMITMRMG